MTPTARSLQLLRKSGYLCAIVEHWNAYAKIRQDLFGIGDLLAVRPGEPILLVQATSLTNVSARLKKAKGKKELAIWLRAGCRFEVFGWWQPGKCGERWQVKRVGVTGEDLAEIVLEGKKRKRKEEPDLFERIANANS